MKYLFTLIILMVPLMGSECSSPDGSVHETSFNGPTAPVPEPSGALIMAVGMVVAAYVMRGGRK